jgi:hypothetical protein
MFWLEKHKKWWQWEKCSYQSSQRESDQNRSLVKNPTIGVYKEENENSKILKN